MASSHKHCVTVSTPVKAFSPFKSTDGSSGIDIIAYEDVPIPPRHIGKISTQTKIKLSPGFAGLLKDKSSVAAKGKTMILAGVIDNDYTGEICVMVFNYSNEEVLIQEGEPFAQLVPVYTGHIMVEWLPMSDFERKYSESERGARGFGRATRKYIVDHLNEALILNDSVLESSKETQASEQDDSYGDEDENNETRYQIIRSSVLDDSKEIQALERDELCVNEGEDNEIHSPIADNSPSLNDSASSSTSDKENCPPGSTQKPRVRPRMGTRRKPLNLLFSSDESFLGDSSTDFDDLTQTQQIVPGHRYLTRSKAIDPELGETVPTEEKKYTSSATINLKKD